MSAPGRVVQVGVQPLGQVRHGLRTADSLHAGGALPGLDEDAIVFISADEEGNPVAVHEMLIDASSTQTRFYANDLNVLCSKSVVDPVDMAARRGRRNASGMSSSSHVFVVNGDGTMGVLHSRRKERVLAWTLWDSPGNAGDDVILRTAVVGNQVYVVTRRTIDGATRYFIERHDEDAIFDCSHRQSAAEPTSTWSGFDHLDGETVAVFADGARRDDCLVVDGTVTVTDGGEALDVSTMEAGLPFQWTLETMPVEGQLVDGTLIGEAHRLAYATLRLRDAYGGITANGRPLPTRRLREVVLGAAPGPFSGLVRVRFLGWQGKQMLGATVTLEGTLPATVESMTLWPAQ